MARATSIPWEMGRPSPCIRVVGTCANITVKNCKFYHVASAVVASLHPESDDNRPISDVMDNILITDNDIQHSERGGTIAVLGDSQRTPGAAYGQLKHVEVLRNRLIDTGFRCGYSPVDLNPGHPRRSARNLRNRRQHRGHQFWQRDSHHRRQEQRQP